MPMKRRDFLQIIVVSAAAVPFTACSDEETAASEERAEFPQSVASGDPKPDSVILWTRAAPSSGSGSVGVRYEVALDDSFAELVAEGSLNVGPDSDWTVRIKLTALSPFTTYFYRFKAGGSTSPVGRTKTAPAPDQAVDVRFAFASCQDFIGRYYHSWRALVEGEAPVDFVVFLGDYIYETNGDPDFQLRDPERSIEIPDGIVLEEGTDFVVKAARTLEDYRGLYRQYRSDPNLQRAHELFPFICIWDDHEFANDAWQDHATDFNEKQGDEKSTERRQVASRAWFEYQPADVVHDPAAAFPDDLKIYRKLRYGKHAELILTDQRSYRDDHAIPEAADPGDSPAGAPGLLYLSAGKLSKNSSIGSRNFVKKGGADTGFDAIEAFVKPSMLGSEQKSWFIDAVKSSDATWKFWGNETKLLQMVLDLSEFPLPETFKGTWYFTVDQWDGFRSERAEILGALAGTQNLVALTGDIHAFYGGELYVDFDNPAEPVAVEYVTAGISSSPAQEITANQVANNETLSNPEYGLAALVPRFDEILTSSAPHYKYAKSLSHGISIVEVTEGAIMVTFLQIADVQTKEWDGKLEKKQLRTLSGSNRVTEV
jgi:alkaline phosphatase D